MYELIDDTIQWVGNVWLIKVNGEYFAVSRARTFDRGDETMIFSCDENANVTDWGDLYAGYGEDHHTAITNWLSERSSDGTNSKSTVPFWYSSGDD